MNEHLLLSLWERGLFNNTSEVEINDVAPTVGHLQKCDIIETFTIRKLMRKPKSGQLVLEGISTTDGRIHRFDPDEILNIDGMIPERFAENYMVDPDGNDIPIQGARRGRKPKHKTAD